MTSWFSNQGIRARACMPFSPSWREHLPADRLANSSGCRSEIFALPRQPITFSTAFWGNRWQFLSLHCLASLSPPIGRSGVDKSEEPVTNLGRLCFETCLCGISRHFGRSHSPQVWKRQAVNRYEDPMCGARQWLDQAHSPKDTNRLITRKTL